MKRKPAPSQERLLDLFEYREADGRLIRRRSGGGHSAGELAGCITHYGYRRASVDYRQYYEHVIVWIMVHGAIPDGFDIDHKDKDRLNNRVENLRLATRSQNNRNCSAQRNNKLGLKGVSKDRSAYRANININGRRHSLGRFPTPEEAHRAYTDAASRLHGEFARPA